MRRLLITLAAFGVLAVPVALAHGNLPEKIALPNGFAPEGIEIRGKTFYTGSRTTGAIFVGNLRKGTGRILVPGVTTTPSTRGATGIEYDRGRLWVAGAGFGNARVYDAKTGALQTRAPVRNTSGDVHQRRRRDEDGRVLHRLAAAGALPGRDLEQWRARRGDDDPAERRVHARRRPVQPERHRRDEERQDADRRPELLEEALH